MKFVAIFSGLLAVASAGLNPPKLPLTPFFQLQVAWAANKTLEGQWMFVGDGYDSTMRLTGNRSAAATFYTAFYKDARVKPNAGTVLVNNATNFIDDSSMWIAGTSTCDTCGLPFSASGFQRSIAGWRDDGGFLYDFALDRISGEAHFNQTDDGTLDQTHTQFCYFSGIGAMYRFVVLSEYLKECVPVKLRWISVGFF